MGEKVWTRGSYQSVWKEIRKWIRKWEKRPESKKAALEEKLTGL